MSVGFRRRWASTSVIFEITILDKNSIIVLKKIIVEAAKLLRSENRKKKK